MSITVDLPPTLERRLAREAEQAGVDAAGYIGRLVERHLTAAPDADADAATNGTAPAGTPQKDPTIALFEQWAIEDATDDPEEIARRNREWEELKQALNENRPSDRPVYPD